MSCWSDSDFDGHGQLRGDRDRRQTRDRHARDKLRVWLTGEKLLPDSDRRKKHSGTRDCF